MPTLEDTTSKDSTPSWLNAVPKIVADEIFSLAADYRLDPNPQKVDLLIGAYRSDDGNPCPLPSVLEAERRILSQNDLGKHEYLPIEGDATYLRLAQKLLFAQDDQSELLQRIVSVQSISGSGAIHIGAAFLSRFLKPRCVWVSDPTWGPHILILERPLTFCVAQSFSKNFGLYGQRTGAFHFINNSRGTTIQSNILQQLRFIIRTEYSTPPRTGCNIVKTILGDPELKSQWLSDVSSMSKRLGQVRSALHGGLSALAESGDFDHIMKQVMKHELCLVCHSIS
ncbi:hypothetical protein CEK26_009200 [Fusarium fujikuroi]|nr:hypothetical protein CEK27_009220 [Fusarium fujikuroi]QGI82498.1 hypothetical protein CEK25_009227 [Fusarium fujikuroi]QGI96131.1 hypothetical protein CEK26_009200 [Fusarium fujikuroi]